MRRIPVEPPDSRGLAPTNVALLRSPLDYIAHDHLRIRAMCAEIDRLVAADRIAKADRARILGFLADDLPALLADEDDALFPMMEARADQDDDVPRLRRRIASDHAAALALLPSVRAILAGWTGDAAGRAEVLAFTEALRRHLVLETAILIPLARLRLRPADLAKLAGAMRRRRGLGGADGTA